MSETLRGDAADRVGRVTIVDVARRAGGSKSTVSLVLSGSGLVAEATKLRVNEAMQALGYVYHRGAASLRAASSDLVGMIMGDLNNPFFAELTAGIEDALFQRGFTPILANTNEDAGRQALNGFGLAADESLIFEVPPTRDGGRIAIGRALDSPQPPTAFACYNDIVAMGATRALALRGVVVGRDIAVIGFDDIADAEHNAPPLTTVSADTREMGMRCAE